jgi:methyl-accepting chemotaxis protein
VNISRHSTTLTYPLFLGLAGAIALLLVGDGHPEAILAALSMMIAATATGLTLQRRQNEAHKAMVKILDDQQNFGAEVAPVWSRHIDSSREQMETAISELSLRFAGIVDKLGEAV